MYIYMYISIYIYIYLYMWQCPQKWTYFRICWSKTPRNSLAFQKVRSKSDPQIITKTFLSNPLSCFLLFLLLLLLLLLLLHFFFSFLLLLLLLLLLLHLFLLHVFLVLAISSTTTTTTTTTSSSSSSSFVKCPDLRCLVAWMDIYIYMYVCMYIIYIHISHTIGSQIARWWDTKVLRPLFHSKENSWSSTRAVSEVLPERL